MKRILIAVRLDASDAHIFRYIARLGNTISQSEIHIVHGVRIPGWSGMIHDPEIQQFESQLPDSEMLRKHAESMGFTAAENSIFKVLRGSVPSEIIHYVDEQAIDTIFLGKRNVAQSVGQLASQLPYNSDATVWVIPESDDPQIKTILFATDFSEASSDAHTSAESLLKNVDSLEKCIYFTAYHVPAGYFKTGMTYDDFAVYISEATAEEQNNWRKRFNAIALEEEFWVEQEEHGTADTILHAAEKAKADLIILGSQGHSRLEAFLLGSTTDRLLRTKHPHAVLLAR